MIMFTFTPYLILFVTILGRTRALNDDLDIFNPVHYFGPGGLIEDVVTLIPECYTPHFSCDNTPPVSKNEISYFLSNRNLTQKYNLLNESNLNLMRPNTKTMMFIPAYLSNMSTTVGQQLVSGYLQRYDCNVISVDYTSLVMTTENRAICNSFGGSKIIASFLCELASQHGLDFDQLHLIGFSLGGQVVGLIGSYTQEICNKKVDRITGLDPAGCAYQHFDTSKRLDKSDANFVDVIHTNMGFLGYYGACGHVDFFPNCGSIQPCTGFDKDMIKILPLVNIVICHHFRSIYYFIESLSLPNPPFRSTSCKTCGAANISGLLCRPDTSNKKYADMGEDCPRNPGASRFYLKTNVFYPYAQG